MHHYLVANARVQPIFAKCFFQLKIFCHIILNFNWTLCLLLGVTYIVGNRMQVIRMVFGAGKKVWFLSLFLSSVLGTRVLRLVSGVLGLVEARVNHQACGAQGKP